MLALQFADVKKIHVGQVPDPKLMFPQDAIVKVVHTAICGSDLHVYHGRETGLDAGTVMGHEFVGEILECGAGVSRLRKGDLVCSPFTSNCGHCWYCLAGLTCRCERGALFGWVAGSEGLHGGQAEYVRVPFAESTLMRIPEGVKPEAALLLGDVLSTGFFATDMADVQPGSVCAIIGCGAVGLMAIFGCRERGARRIFAVDSVPERLLQAEQFGAEALNYQQVDVAATVREATGGRGADAVLELVGSPQAGELAYCCVRPGGSMSVAGVHTTRHFAFSPVQAYDKNLRLATGRCPARAYMPKLLPLVQEEKYPFVDVISHRMALQEGSTAYEIFDLKMKGCTKVVLNS